MKNFIERLQNLLNNNSFVKRTQVAVSTEDTYIIHIYGCGEHVFSVKIAAFPNDIICFFGYDKEVILPLNDKNFAQIADLINSAINFGTRVVKIFNGKNTGIYEFIADNKVTPDEVLNRLNLKEVSGKVPGSCQLFCSDFCGGNTFEIEAV
ncbi:MAG: hypothetical protein LUD27_01555 [Clostridia bacterium]|nr:hypothetical protein [Clostridia bacterium]